MIAYIILAKFFSKKYVNKFFWRANNYLKKKIVIYKLYIKKIDNFFFQIQIYISFIDKLKTIKIL